MTPTRRPGRRQARDPFPTGPLSFARRIALPVAACLLAAVAAPAARALPLQEAVRIATERDAGIAGLQQQVARETTNVRIARDARLPQISLSGDSSTTDSDGPGVNLTITQILFDWGAVRSEIAMASQERVKIVSELKMAVEDLTLEVSELYLDLEVVQMRIARTQDYVDFAQRIAGFSEDRAAGGLGDTAEVARARLEIARADDRMQQLQADRQMSLAQLEFLLGGVPPGPEPAPRLAFTERFSSSAEIIAAVNLAPDYVAARADVDIAEAGILAARAASRPRIQLQAQGRADLNGGRGRTALGITAGVDLDRGSFLGRGQRAAEQDLAAAEAQLRAVERELQNQARISVDQIRILTANEEAQLLQLAQAGEVLDAYEQQFVAGSRELLDLLTTGRDLYEAQMDQVDTYDERKRTEYVAAHSVGMLGTLLFASRRGP